MFCDDVPWPAHFSGGKSGVPGTAPLVQGTRAVAFLFQHSTSGALARILQAVKVWLSTHPPLLGVVGRKKREEEERDWDRDRYRKVKKGRGDEEGDGFWAGMCSISCSASSKALCPSSWVSCFAFTAGLFTGLSVQREKVDFLQHLYLCGVRVVLGGYKLCK